MDFSKIMDMIKNPQAIQAKMNELRSRTASIRATGSSGGGMVRVTLSGEMEMLTCEISPEAIDPADPGMLQDLVRAAHHDASEKIKEALQKEVADGMGGMGGMGGMQLPPDLFGGGSK